MSGLFEEFAQVVNLRRYKERVYAVMGAYLDESFDKKRDGIFAVGGIVGRGIPTFELDRKWEALLRRPDIDIEYLKASECEVGVPHQQNAVDPKKASV